MKKYLRLFLINLFSLWGIANLLEGISFIDGWRVIASAALVLTLVNLIVKPLIKILLLPINLLTLGMFRWLINVISLYLVTIIVPQFQVTGFLFPGWTYQGFVAPPVYLTPFWVFVLASCLISFATTFLLWLAKK